MHYVKHNYVSQPRHTCSSGRLIIKIIIFLTYIPYECYICKSYNNFISAKNAKEIICDILSDVLYICNVF